MIGLDLSGKIAVVTGGSGDLGRTMVRTLGRCGADVAVNYLDDRAMDDVLRDLAKELGKHQITVKQVATGWTISDRVRETHSEIQEAYTKPVPMARRGDDQENANVVAFPASDLAS